jgi:subtilisin family serine protease
MTDRTIDSDETDLSRRTFMKGVGAATAATALGSTVPAAAEQTSIDEDLLNYRVLEAREVWKRGYTGKPNRSIGLTDSGIERRHPDLGPWNGVTTILQGGEFKATTTDALDSQETEALGAFARETDWEGVEEEAVRFEGDVGPGTFVEGTEVVLGTFGQDGDEPIPGDASILTAKLYWEPFDNNDNDLELRIDRQTDDGWTEQARAATAGMPEVVSDIEVDPTGTYRYVAEAYKNVNCTAWMEEFFVTYGELDTRYDADGSFDAIAEESAPEDKIVGWFDAGRYGDHPAPADPDGHGSHCSSIMAGTGEASTVDPDTVQTDENLLLLPTDTRQFEVTAEAGTGVFASAHGDAVEIVIEGPDGREIERSGPPSGEADVSVVGASIDLSDAIYADSSIKDNTIADHPTVHDSGEATYTITVRPYTGEAVSTARIEKVAVGAFRDPDEVASAGGGLQATDEADVGASAVHAGLAPDQRLVGLQGLSGPLSVLADHGDDFTEWFGLRAVNMSWSYVDPVTGLGTPPFGAAGGAITDDPAVLKRMAEQGILTVAAAGNSFTPGQTSTPALADEAISVVATDALDGIVEFSSGGTLAEDEDGEGTYAKPDVTAPGGTLFDNGIRAARAELDSDADQVRDYVQLAGTSMASPYTTGVAGLVAQAMEEDAPDALSLPEPEQTEIDDVLRLKSVILSTASETAFTAAPYHRAHTPTYDFGGRDIYEGYGRVNPDAAVDAVTRELLDGTDLADEESTGTVSLESVGLNQPKDARAVAGYVRTRGGTLDVSVDFSHYGGGNKGMTKGDPHLDLFVYDSEPADHGEPNVLASAQGLEGSASTSVDVPSADPGSDATNERTVYVVAKLVNVPGVVNGYDVQAYFDFGLEFEAGVVPDVTTEFTASGSRSDDGRAFTGGSTNRVRVTVEDFENASEVSVTDQVPDGWTAYEDADAENFDEDSGTVTFAETVTDDQVGDGDSVTFAYFAEAPSGASQTGSYTFGPATAEVVSPDVPEEDTNGELDGDEQDTFGGTDTNYVVGADQSEPTSSRAGDATSTASDAGSSATESGTSGATEAVPETAGGVNESL